MHGDGREKIACAALMNLNQGDILEVDLKT